MDPVSLIVGVVIFVAGAITGLVLRQRPRAASPKTPKPVCSCRHARSFHGKDGRCHATHKVYEVWDPQVDDHIDKLVQCGCQQYDGPEPLPEFYAPQQIG